MRIGFLMDPLDSVRVDHDSTFALMLEAQKRGHEIRELRQDWLFAMNGRAWSRMRTVRVWRQTSRHFEVVTDRAAPIDDLDIVFLRKDPPVDLEFLHATQLVELSSKPLFVNSPAGLRAANEKLWALNYPDLMPRTLVTRDREKIAAFLETGPAVVKPLDGCGGQGVFKPESADDARIEGLVMLQQYLPEVAIGDKRIILLDGEPAGAILRVPQRGAFLANMAAGGEAVRTVLTDRDREICARLAPGLRRMGLWLVGIDVIGGYLTEVNVTSPTGFVEIEKLTGLNVAAQTLDMATGLRFRAVVGI